MRMAEELSKLEIKIGGFGGQGIILSGIILGMAAAIYDSKHTCLIKSYGPEARGGACNVQIILSTNQILYPYVVVPDVLVVLSQEAYAKYSPEMDSNGILLYEKDMVKLTPTPRTEKIFSIPATHLAENLGKRVVTNIVMLGFCAAVSEAVSRDAMGNAIKSTVPKGTIDLNMKAYEEGFRHGLSQISANSTYIPPGRRLSSQCSG